MEADTTDTLLAAQNLNEPEERKRAVYAAFASHDARFDGQVFVGVSSTRIYCRPVCTARLPKFENCTFFHSAAEAEAAGFRPCMTCRPETAPGRAPVDAAASLARRAAELLREECASSDSLERAAARLGYTSRHLRRVFEEEFSVTPVQYLQTCRLLLAKSLLTDTALPVAQVARAAGFGSTRRMNALFRERYRLAPTDLRKHAKKPARTAGRADGRQAERGTSNVGGSTSSGSSAPTAGTAAAAEPGSFTVRLSYRPPYGFDKLLAFFRARALEGVEVIGADFYLRTARIPLPGGEAAHGWVRVQNDAGRNALSVTLSESLLPALPQVIARIRRQFDTDCDPRAIYERIASLNDAVPGAAVLGTRLPGCFDPFETAVRAVLGQQVTVTAANKLAARIVQTYGTPAELAKASACSGAGKNGESSKTSSGGEHGTPSKGEGRSDSAGGHGNSGNVGRRKDGNGASEGDRTDAPGSLANSFPQLTHFFPTASELAALDPIEDALGTLGVIKTRSRTIAAIARLIVAGELDLSPNANATEQMERLLAIKGIGPWSANYIAMRTMSYPDAFLETDAGIKHALPDLSPKERLALAEQWRPWRSYANVSLWNSLG